MGTGIGVVLLVIGAILYWAIDVDIPGINEDATGVILMLAGLLAIGLALYLSYQRSNTRTTYVQQDRRTDNQY
ncbi:hypothetical protein KLP28_05755 [Nocardioidaceae bacterium]|nr:hypothetical protein KLP28_05755 [Nocardioidaceae bacterium]